MKDIIRRILLQFFEKTRELQRQLDHTNEQVQGLARLNNGLKRENEGLSLSALNFRRLRQYIGADKTDEIIRYVERQEVVQAKRRDLDGVNRMSWRGEAGRLVVVAGLFFFFALGNKLEKGLSLKIWGGKIKILPQTA